MGPVEGARHTGKYHQWFCLHLFGGDLLLWFLADIKTRWRGINERSVHELFGVGVWSGSHCQWRVLCRSGEDNLQGSGR